MTEKSLSSISTDQLLTRYEELAKEHAHAAKAAAANLAAKGLLAIRLELRRRGRADHAQLLALLEHQDDSVRLWAATHTLEIDALKAEQVLEGLAAGSQGAVRASAAMTLREWQAGRLRF